MSDAYHLRRAVVAVAPICDFYTTPHRLSSLGARCVVQVLERLGIETHLCDFPSQCKRGAVQSLPSAMGYLKPYIVENEFGPISFFTRYRRFGPPALLCAREIGQRHPDVVLLSCWAFCYATTTLELAREVKKSLPHVVVIVGGAGVNVYPAFFARCDGVDIACTGEAEAVLPELVRALRRGDRYETVPGVWFRQNGIVRSTRQAVYAREDELETTFSIGKSSYYRPATRITTYLSRGCPRQCRFCSIALSHGRAFRRIQLEKIEKAMAALPDRHGDERVEFNLEDDNVLYDQAYLFSAIDIFRRHYGRIGLYLENGLDYLLCDPSIVERLADYGLMQLNISLGAATVDSAVKERRPLDVEHFETIVQVAVRKNLPCITYFICGLEGDNPATVAHTLAYLYGQPVRIGISLFYPVPGLEGFEDKRLFDRISPALTSGAAAYPWNNTLDSRSLITAFRLARYINACKRGYAYTQAAALLNRIGREQRLYTFIRDGNKVKEIELENADREMVREFFSACQRVYGAVPTCNPLQHHV